MKIISIVGARPNFIKATMISKELRKKHKEILIHTGQHYDTKLNKIFFDQLEVPEPNYYLGVGSGTHAQQTGQIMIRAEKIIIKEKPNWVIVYGDINSTLAGALEAAKLSVRIPHVEAGMRNYNNKTPEEINRMLVDHLSSLLFAPTQSAVENLKKENLTRGTYKTGDVMYDAVLTYKSSAEKKSKILTKLNLKPQGFLVATIHRAETTNNTAKLSSVMKAFSKINESIIFPVHPRTQRAIEALGGLHLGSGNVKMINPVSYFDMLKLVKNARLLITDSGGLQKEAYFLKTPCVTCLEDNNWPETTTAGANQLIGTDVNDILNAVKKPYQKIKNANEFGNGHAAEKIVAILEEESSQELEPLLEKSGTSES